MVYANGAAVNRGSDGASPSRGASSVVAANESCARGRSSIGPNQHGRRIRGEHNVLMPQPRFGPGLGAPLAHAHAVPPAMTFDEADPVAVADHLHEARIEDRVLRGVRVDGPAELFAGEAVA